MSICQMLEIEYPIFQGAMARISTHKLVGAVSQAGGLGILASGGWTAEELREEIRLTREITDKPFGVNLMLQMGNIDALVEVIIEEKVKLVTTGAGSPEKYIPALKEAGIFIMPVIASVRHATKMEKLGVDGVIAEGQEAGGHIGQSSTMSLLPQIVDAVDIPVIGAGGIGDGRSVAAMYALGAQGIQVGTLFLATEECPISENYKQKLLEANDTATIVTGRRYRDPVRSLNNPMLVKFAELEAADAPKEEVMALTEGSLAKAVLDGDMDNGSAMAGEVSGMIKEILSCQDLIQRLFKEAEEVVNQLKILY